MPARLRTIEDIAGRGLRLRLWCYRCARARDLDADVILRRFAKRGWPIEIEHARSRFRCRLCQSADDVLIVPASPPRITPRQPERVRTWAQEVEAFFHGMRRQAKQDRRR